MQWKEVAPLEPANRQINRPAGLHVKEIINAMALEFMVNRGDASKKGVSEESLKQMANVGFMWEDIIAGAYGESTGIVRPDPLQVDGIWMSPDGVDDNNTVHEYKVKWMSSNKTPDSDNFWRDITQIKAYCYGVVATSAVLQVLHLNGDYKWGREGKPWPEPKRYELAFTQLELQENWEMITSYAKAKGWLK